MTASICILWTVFCVTHSSTCRESPREIILMTEVRESAKFDMKLHFKTSKESFKRLLKLNCQPFDDSYTGTTPSTIKAYPNLYPTLPSTPFTEVTTTTTQKSFWKKLIGWKTYWIDLKIISIHLCDKLCNYFKFFLKIKEI